MARAASSAALRRLVAVSLSHLKIRKPFANRALWALIFAATLLFTVSPLPATTVAVVQGAGEQIIQQVAIHGNRRIPAETIRARLITKAGDVYDPASLERDFNSLWNTGYFDDIRFEREDTPKGVVLHIYVKEKPTINRINYVGLSSVTQSDVLDRYKKAKVSVSQESQYDPTKVKRAEVVLKEMLAEHGRQFATVRTEIHQAGASRVDVTFIVKEGPKVKVGKITFEGNRHVSNREARAAMKNLKPIGIPHSIFLENIFSRTYDASRLDEDTERLRDAFQQRGFFKATVEPAQTQIRDTGHAGFHIPLIQHGRGKVVDIHMKIDEGERYRLGWIKFTGGKAFTNMAALRAMFPIRDGEIFNIQRIRDGIKNLQTAYNQYGYINFTAVPRTDFDEEKKLVLISMELDEGKQFYVRRIEFQGNTTTRDKVIRRELALEEGNLYNKKAWEFSLVRLNQLGYFEQLKPDDDTVVTRNEATSTVDLTLKVKEKGKNSIGLTGGVSGLEGSFIGLNYQTNNFLGLGETLTVSASVGNLSRNLMFGFTEPYLFDRSLQFGFTVYGSKYNYDQAKQLSILFGQNVNLPQSQLNLLQNFTQSSTGFTTSLGYTLHRSFKRVGLTYAFDTTSIQTFSDVSRELFQQLNFRNISGPNALNGIITSRVQPSFSFSSVNGSFNPQGGHSVLASMDIAGLGGNTRYLRPVLDYKQFVPMKFFRRTKETGRHQILAYHLQAAFITGYGGLVASPFQRFWMGGENDLRGFDIRSISPVAFLVNRVDQPLVSPSDACLTVANTPCSGIPVDPSNPRKGIITVPTPVNQIVFPGGDTQVFTNIEYRIPIAGPVVLAPFVDTGINAILLPTQLQLAPEQLGILNSTNFGCPTIIAGTGCSGGTPITFTGHIKPVGSTNWKPRMSTGLELQVLMPIINAPLRVYWAYNPLRLDNLTDTPSSITRSMFPAGGAGDITYLRTLSLFAPTYVLREPVKTFRFTVSTTF